MVRDRTKVSALVAAVPCTAALGTVAVSARGLTPVRATILMPYGALGARIGVGARALHEVRRRRRPE